MQNVRFFTDQLVPTDQHLIAFVAVLLKFSSKSLTGFSVAPRSLADSLHIPFQCFHVFFITRNLLFCVVNYQLTILSQCCFKKVKDQSFNGFSIDFDISKPLSPYSDYVMYGWYLV